MRESESPDGASPLRYAQPPDLGAPMPAPRAILEPLAALRMGPEAVTDAARSISRELGAPRWPIAAP